MIALLFYAKYGTRDSQAVLGTGNASHTTNTGHASFAGIEGVHGAAYEWVAGVTITDGVWTITDPESATTRTVTATKTAGTIQEIAASTGPRFDMVPTTVISSDYYADDYIYNTGSRVLARSGSSTGTYGGVSYTNTSIASRLSFRGTIKEAASVGAFQALPVNN